MTEGIDCSEAEGSASTIVQKSSSSTSQSVSKVSSSMTTTSGDGDPVVSCQIEESSLNEASATCSAIEMKDGEVVSSMEQSGQSRDEAVRNATMEGDSMIETSAQLHQAAMVTKADGDIVQQHQESDFTEDRKEVNMQQTIENDDDSKKDLDMEKGDEEEDKGKDSSSSSDEEEKRSIAEVDDQLPPPPQDDFPPPPAETDMITSVEDLPPPVFDLPSPSDELLPPPSIPNCEEDENNDVVLEKDESNTEEASKDGKSSYVALVSPTGFVPASFADSTTDNDKNIALTNSNLDVTESLENK